MIFLMMYDSKWKIFEFRTAGLIRQAVGRFEDYVLDNIINRKKCTYKNINQYYDEDLW